MAAVSLSTSLSRRTMLAGALAAPPAFAVPAPAIAADSAPTSDRDIARLADDQRRAVAALIAWIDLAEERAGPLAYHERDYRARYDALCARQDRCTAALAAARPGGLAGLVLKLRPAFHCTSLHHALLDSNPILLRPALHDLERLAAADLARLDAG